MEEFSLISFLVKHLSLVVGLVFVVVASAVLPGRLRWYVLTAGLAVIAFRIIQLRLADNRLKEADEQRGVLRTELGNLNKQREELNLEVKEKNKKLDDINTRKISLEKEARALEKQGGNIAERKTELDKEMRKFAKKNKELLAEVESGETALSFFEEADQAYAELESNK